MRVTDAAAVPKPPEQPPAELVGLQFGLATTKDFAGFSVIAPKSQDSISTLIDPRLGLPAEDEKCATCGGINYEECAGHFAHVNLSQPIFHPNHMRLLLRILQKICLACGKPKVRKKKNTFGVEVQNRKQSYAKDFSLLEEVNEGREHLAIVEAEPIERRVAGARDVIELSSEDDDGDDIAGILRVASAIPYGPMDFRVEPGSTSQPSLMEISRLEISKSKGKAHAVEPPHPEVPANTSKKYANLKSRNFTQNPGESSAKAYKGRPPGLDVLNVDALKTVKSSGPPVPCKHCSQPNPAYRPILVKIRPMKGRKEDDKYEILLLEVQPSKKEDDRLPDDFWAFLQGPAGHFKGQTNHVLSPSEAYSILRKIPVQAIGKLGMNRLVAQPKALILHSVPIPPNCTRTADYKYVSNMTAVRFGSDKVTRALQNLVNEIIRIQRTRSGPAMYKAQRDESTSLQILTAAYFREKGAPKAVSGTEPLKKDRNGRVTKQDDHRWTKTWLSENLLAKSGNYTAKAVIVGDPSLNIEEIGVPWEVAQKLTLPERVSRWNCAKLQEYVDRSQTTVGAGSCEPSAARVERNGEAFQVFPNSMHKVEIGDVIHRNIQDGDYVYANRCPSVHKHSLIALKVRVHHGLVLTVNPLICPPFGADFDGDIFHIFIPQSLQAMAEVEQLIAVPHQLVSDHGGQPLLGLTEETLLAAHLLTSGKIFVDKATMDQLCLWSSKQPPKAAILKSPKGGSLWTGDQVFGLTLPAQLNMGSSDESILIQGGEITKWNEPTNLLRKDKEGIASALCLQLGPLALLDYLNNATGLLHAWLQAQGFSSGLVDFQVTHSSAARQEMHQRIFEEHFQKSMKEACISVRIPGPEKIMMNPEDLTRNVRVLEQSAQEIFRAREIDAEKIVMKFAEKNNPLLLMVKSGSKGSRGKLLQQVAGMGLQLCKGRHLFPLAGVRRPSISDDPLLDWWKNRGLVQSSLLDGLKATELFNHVVADRARAFRKRIEMTQPGTLFKSLMLFLRDLHVAYDGSVRSQSGKNIIQFCYGGAEGVRGPSGVWGEDDQKRWHLSRLAGEPVGVLAATAVSQPAYDVMLDAPTILSGPFNPRPLDLLQETLYPREKTDLKQIDRCAIIRFEQCLCSRPFCQEKSALAVQAFLTKITLRELAESSAIQYWNMEDTSLAGPCGDALESGSPWLGHIKLSLDIMLQQRVTVEDILQRLREKYGAIVRNSKKNRIGQVFFCSSYACSVSNGCCLHFSPRLPKKLQNERNDDVYNDHLLSLLMKIRATIIPGLLDCTVKGDERIESVRIVREGPSRTTWHHSLLPAYRHDLDEELVLEIVVSPTKPKSDRSLPWASVKEACLPFADLVDWNRSTPYSIQQIRHSLGIEAAYAMVTRRLRLVFETTAPHTHHDHEKLIADTMTFTGSANGFTISGFQDMNKSTAVSAPFTEASFRKPIRTLLDAAGRGANDSVEGVMTSCVWGKEAPLGTGSSFDVLWQPARKDHRKGIQAEKDVHAIWRDLDEKCIPDKIVPPSPPPSLPSLRVMPMELNDGAAFSPEHAIPNSKATEDMWNNSSNQNNDATWRNSPEAGDGGWGGGGTASSGGGWDQDEEQGGWGSQKITSGDAWDQGGGWNDRGDGSVQDKLPPNGDDGTASKLNAQKSSKDLGGWGPSTQGERKSTNWGTDPTQSSGWDDLSSSSMTPPERNVKLCDLNSECPDTPQHPQDRREDEDVDWGQLISGVKKATLGHGASSSAAGASAGDGWDTVQVPENTRAAGMIRPAVATHKPSVGAMSDTLRQLEISEPECKEIDDDVKSMRRILLNNKHRTGYGTRLSDKDDEAVQAVLAYHPDFKEKAGCGVAYIKVEKSQAYSDSNCFWLVRTDGSEVDFSYHKCLKEKLAREFPAFAPDWYDNLYRSKRPRDARPADQPEDITVTQPDPESSEKIGISP